MHVVFSFLFGFTYLRKLKNLLDIIHLLIYDFVYLGFVFQSDSASVKVPELELELSCGTLGGMVTTVEGLIVKICEGRSASLYSPILSFYDAKMLCTHLLKLRRGFESDMCLYLPLFFFSFTALERIHGFQLGDSTLEWKKKKWEDFKERLSKVISLLSLYRLMEKVLP